MPKTFHVKKIDNNKYVCKGGCFTNLNEIIEAIEKQYSCIEFNIEVRMADKNTNAFWSLGEFLGRIPKSPTI